MIKIVSLDNESSDRAYFYQVSPYAVTAVARAQDNYRAIRLSLFCGTAEILDPF